MFGCNCISNFYQNKKFLSCLDIINIKVLFIIKDIKKKYENESRKGVVFIKIVKDKIIIEWEESGCQI